MKNACDLLEKNGFLKVEIALLKNDLYFECNNTVTGISDNSENLLNVPVSDKAELTEETKNFESEYNTCITDDLVDDIKGIRA